MTLNRLGTLMEPEPGNPKEAWGVLNPASARTRDGRLLLFPRAVAEGNFSRIESADVTWEDGRPARVRRRGFALEPETSYERDKRASGGVEDPRVTYIRPLGIYAMAYVALGRLGPRVAVAVSEDAHAWRRLGLLRFCPEANVDFTGHGNKDAAFFPDIVNDPTGRQCLAILHRPTYLIARADGTTERNLPKGVEDTRGSIWMSYIALEPARQRMESLVETYHSTLVATPAQEWESLKIGAGPPPILTSEGWLLIYHGVSGTEPSSIETNKDVCYRAGAMLLDRDDPRRALWRTSKPVLSPETAEDMEGVVANVVFPTAVDVRGQRIFVFYGSADTRISTATTVLNAEIIIPPSEPDANEPVSRHPKNQHE